MKRTVELSIQGMTCAHCVTSVRRALEKLPGVEEVRVTLEPPRATVTYDDTQVSVDALLQAVEKAGYHALLVSDETKTVSPEARKVASVVHDYTDKGQHLIIVGGGSAAFAAAIRADELGARVTMINGGLPIGGTCVNVGCVPSKALIRAAEAHWHAAHHPFRGIRSWSEVEHFAAMVQQKNELLDTLRKKKYIDVLKGLEHVRYVEGYARIVDPETVEVNGERISGDRILVATGSSAFIPPIAGIEDVPYLTNEQVFNLEELPPSLLILGANYIGLETAQLFARLGSRVTVLELASQILPGEMADVATAVQGYLEAEGIQFRTGFNAQGVEQTSGGLRLWGHGPQGEETFEATYLVVATGRKGNTRGLGLEDVGVRVDARGFMQVDETLKSDVPTIYGAGDVIGGPLFVYKAAYDGKLATENALTGARQARDYSAMPYVMFTEPQVAGVGLDERQAEEQGLTYEVTSIPLDEIPRAQVGHEHRGFIKLLRDPVSDRLLGARVVAPEGGEIIMEAVMAIRFGITTEQMVDLFHPYLTLAEGMKLTALTFRKELSMLSCCAV